MVVEVSEAKVKEALDRASDYLRAGAVALTRGKQAIDLSVYVQEGVVLHVVYRIEERKRPQPPQT